MFDLLTEIDLAYKNIHAFVRETPLEYSPALSKCTQTSLYLKCENLQHTGSFKVRGAFNALLSLSSNEKKEGIVTASTGNHGAAVAYAMQKLGVKGTIFIPENAAATKIQNIYNYTNLLKQYGTDSVETELYAKDYALQHQIPYISPYNHPKVVAGQGTIGIELTQQLQHMDAVFIAVGGGGLIGGIARYIKSVSPKTKVYGCVPSQSPVMLESIKQGKVLSMETFPTLSDATSGGIEPDSLTFELCQNYVDDFVSVTEEEIKQALILLLEKQHLLVEGASGVALASLLRLSGMFHGKNVVAVLSGANISLTVLKQMLI